MMTLHNRGVPINGNILLRYGSEPLPVRNYSDVLGDTDGLMIPPTCVVKKVEFPDVKLQINFVSKVLVIFPVVGLSFCTAIQPTHSPKPKSSNV